jgi:predicted hydrocarbon binding protein
MRYILISEEELNQIKDLYEGVLSHAAQGLFYREGILIGNSISRETGSGPDRLSAAMKEITRRRWATSMTLDSDAGKVTVNGSAEVCSCEEPTCHRMRGILSALFERQLCKKVLCREVECRSTGAKNCIFIISTNSSWI